MAEFPVNTTRFDPYKASKFRVKWDGEFIPGIIKVGPLERGRTQDQAFEAWANKVWSFGAGPGSEVSLKDFRKDIRIELLNEAGQLVLA